MSFTQTVTLPDGTIVNVGGTSAEELAANVAAVAEAYEAQDRRRQWVDDFTATAAVVKQNLRDHLDADPPTGTTGQLIVYLYDRVQELTRVLAGIPGTPGLIDDAVIVTRRLAALIERAEDLEPPD